MLPDFIIIGAMKSGTTSLYHYLKAHPQIGMSKIKETNFFIKERNFNKKLDWYKSQFEGNYKIYGEASPNYAKAHLFEGVPKRMYELIPEAKLLYVLRDPIDRIISHYTHNVGVGRESGAISDTLQNEKKFDHYVMCSRYYWQIQQFLEYFPKEQILIISSAKLRADRESALREVFEFLGVNDRLDEKQLQNEFGVTKTKTRTGKIGRSLLNNFIMNFFKKNISTDFKRRIKKLFFSPLKKPSQVDSLLKSKLKESLQPDAEALRSFTGKPFKEWSV